MGFILAAIIRKKTETRITGIFDCRFWIYDLLITMVLCDAFLAANCKQRINQKSPELLTSTGDF